jgi:transglutaminase-like putative cysteine protease
MRFSRSWRSIETPDRRVLVDAALIVGVLPHLATVRLPVLLYMGVVLVLLLRGKTPARWAMVLMGVLGLLAIAASFLGAFRFVGFSEFSTFIQLVASLLIYAISLQRLSREINFYLLISPLLLLALAYFFYTSIFMLFYAVASLYLYLLLLLWAQMRASLAEAVRSALMLFMASLPIVVLLFMAFPRISFKKGDFGFRDTASLRTGHDGLMHIGSEALLVPSKKVAMEVWFDAGLPEEKTLYFRGSVLYNDDGEVWRPALFRRDIGVLGSYTVPGSISYAVTVYPHKKRWLYLLDYPASIDRKANYSRDLIATWDKPLDVIFRYRAASLVAAGTAAEVERHIMRLALQVHGGRDPQSEAAMARIAREHGTEEERLEALNAWFAAQKLYYSLKPGKVDLEHPVDAFLFGSRRGYCVHFASAYATLARMLGIPSRVVTGFRGDAAKSVEHYLVVREEDAHAWVELHRQGRGWVRVDPTTFAAGTVSGGEEAGQSAEIGEAGTWQRFAAQLDLYVLYAKFVLYKWVLYYDRLAQVQLLRELLQNTWLVLKFAAAFVLLIAAGVLTYVTLRREQCSDRILCAVRPLLETLAKAGIIKESGEDMHTFLQRGAAALKRDLAPIDRLYHDLRYGGADGKRAGELERLCRDFKLGK